MADINFKWWSAYDELKHLEKPRYIIYAITGGRDSAKTKHTKLALLSVGAKCKKRIVCLRETWTTIEDSLYTEFKNSIDAGFSEAGWGYNSEKMWNTKTGSTIVFKGLNDRNQSSRENKKGLSDVDIFWIDEAQTITKASFDVFLPLIREENACAIFTFNRILVDLPVWECLFLDNPPEYTYFLETCYLDNPFLSETALKLANTLREKKPEEHDWFYLNKPQNMSSNTVVKYFTSENIKHINYCPDMDLHITCDFNVDPMAWILAHKTDEKVFFFDEIVIENTTTKQCVDEFYARYPLHSGKIIINGDASGDNRSTQSEFTNYVIIRNRLKELGYKDVEIQLRSGNPSIVKRRIPAWNNKILSNKGNREILIDPKCKWLIYNCKNLKYKEGTSQIDVASHTQIKTDRNAKFLVHPFDAASYLVEFYFPVTLDYEYKESKPHNDIPTKERFNV